MYSDISLEIFLLESIVKVTVRFCKVDWGSNGRKSRINEFGRTYNKG